MTVVHRFIRPAERTVRRDRQGEAEILILPCIRRERYLDLTGHRLAAERAAVPAVPSAASGRDERTD